jgi:SET domain-containing protein
MSKAKPAPTTSPWARRGRSSIHGRGMYATTFIPKGTRIIEYVGERITKVESDRRDDERIARQKRGEDGCVYIFELNKRHDLDGDVSWNTARLINHSCGPNCEPQGIRGRIWIVAIRDIPAGEELTYDYGFDFQNWEDHPCRCGLPDCFGYIVKRNQRWRVRRILEGRRAAPAPTAAQAV